MEKKLIAGPRGGMYWLDDKGVKHYVSGKQKKEAKKTKSNKVTTKSVTKPVISIKKVETPKLKQYSAKITKYDSNGEYVDDFNEWRAAYSKEEAISQFREDYPNERRYDIYIFEVTDYEE